MILTGKAKEDFLKWLKKIDNDFGVIDIEPSSVIITFEDLDDNLQNTVIIEWLETIAYKNTNIYSYVFMKNYFCLKEYITIQSFAKMCIIKANEIYNEM